MKISYSILLTVFLVAQTDGASVILDSFTEGAVDLSAQGTTGEAIALVTPFGETRFTGINPRGVASSTILNASIKPDLGQLVFTANGSTTNPNNHLYVELSYTNHESHSIIGYTGLIFSFSTLLGQGVIGVGTFGTGTIPDSEYRISVMNPGDIFYPIEKLYIDEFQSVSGIRHLYFIFAATSEQFSFTLDEIRFVVPEPASLALLAGGAVLTLRRRRISLTSV